MGACGLITSKYAGVMCIRACTPFLTDILRHFCDPCLLPALQGNLKKVQRLDFSNNLLARIPPSMGHLKFLKEFGLRYNSLDDR